jgi:hypothetical protein
MDISSRGGGFAAVLPRSVETMPGHTQIKPPPKAMQPATACRISVSDRDEYSVDPCEYEPIPAIPHPKIHIEITP